MWARNPLPACATPSGGNTGCKAPPQFPPPNNDDRFYGFSATDLPYAIQDKLQLPADLEEGDYVLGFRYDCEQTPQVSAQAATRFLSSHFH